MKNITKYSLSVFAAIVLSLTLSGVAAAFCSLETTDAYTCYVIGEDENYCYYQCYCKTNWESCRSALEGDGFEILN